MYKYVNVEKLEKAAACFTGNYRLNYLIGTMMSKTLRFTGTRSFDAHEVLPGVYVGDVYAAHNLRELKKRNITHVINAVLAITPPFPNDFKYLHVPLLDFPGENISQHLQKTTKFIEDALADGGRVFVHCLQGVSRSATIACAYAIYSHQLTVKEAVALLRKSRTVVCPNHGFLAQLANYEKETAMAKEGAKALKQMDAPSAPPAAAAPGA